MPKLDIGKVAQLASAGEEMDKPFAVEDGLPEVVEEETEKVPEQIVPSESTVVEPAKVPEEPE